jgi:hypothetical protein
LGVIDMRRRGYCTPTVKSGNDAGETRADP